MKIYGKEFQIEVNFKHLAEGSNLIQTLLSDTGNESLSEMNLPFSSESVISLLANSIDSHLENLSERISLACYMENEIYLENLVKKNLISLSSEEIQIQMNDIPDIFREIVALSLPWNHARRYVKFQKWFQKHFVEDCNSLEIGTFKYTWKKSSISKNRIFHSYQNRELDGPSYLFDEDFNLVERSEYRQKELQTFVKYRNGIVLSEINGKITTTYHTLIKDGENEKSKETIVDNSFSEIRGQVDTINCENFCKKWHVNGERFHSFYRNGKSISYYWRTYYICEVEVEMIFPCEYTIIVVGEKVIQIKNAYRRIIDEWSAYRSNGDHILIIQNDHFWLTNEGHVVKREKRNEKETIVDYFCCETGRNIRQIKVEKLSRK